MGHHGKARSRFSLFAKESHCEIIHEASQFARMTVAGQPRLARAKQDPPLTRSLHLRPLVASLIVRTRNGISEVTVETESNP
jgi:hypothetical protein